MQRVLQERGVSAIDATAIFGGVDAIPGSDNDLYALAERCAASGKPLPRIYLSCGTEDAMLLAQNRRFAPFLRTWGSMCSMKSSPAPTSGRCGTAACGGSWEWSRSSSGGSGCDGERHRTMDDRR